jgi:hypothetical protein
MNMPEFNVLEPIGVVSLDHRPVLCFLHSNDVMIGFEVVVRDFDRQSQVFLDGDTLLSQGRDCVS